MVRIRCAHQWTQNELLIYSIAPPEWQNVGAHMSVCQFTVKIKFYRVGTVCILLKSRQVVRSEVILNRIRSVPNNYLMHKDCLWLFDVENLRTGAARAARGWVWRCTECVRIALIADWLSAPSIKNTHHLYTNITDKELNFHTKYNFPFQLEHLGTWTENRGNTLTCTQDTTLP